MKVLYKTNSKRKTSTEQILDPFIGKDIWVRIAEANYSNFGNRISYAYIKVLSKEFRKPFDWEWAEPQLIYVCDVIDWPTFESIQREPEDAFRDILHHTDYMADSFGVVMPIECYTTDELFCRGDS